MLKYFKGLQPRVGCVLVIVLLFVTACDSIIEILLNDIPAAEDFDIHGLEQIYDGTPKSVTIKPKEGKSTGNITIYYSNNTTPPTNVGEYAISFDVAQATGWNAKKGLYGVMLKIKEKDGSFVNIAPIDIVYSPELTLADLNLPENYTWNTPTTPLSAGDEQIFPATYTHPSGDYEPSNGNIIVNISKADGAVVEKPELDIASINSITINAVPAPDNGQTVEYARSTNTTVPVSGWQDGLTFSGLNGNTMYFIFARSKENTNYNAGTAVSVGILTHSGFTVNFTQPGDEEIDLNISSNVSLSQAANGYVDISIVQTFNTVRWYINGELDETRNDEPSIRVYAAALNTGICSVTAVVYDGSAWYSKRLTFTVGK